MAEDTKEVKPNLRWPMEQAARAMGKAADELGKLTIDSSCGPAMRMALTSVKSDLEREAQRVWQQLPH